MGELRVTPQTRKLLGFGGLIALALLICFANAGRVSVYADGTGSKPVEFNRDILPILSDNCFTCHGPDEARRKANLRLDEKESVFANRGGYYIVVPGKSAESKLYQKVSAKDETERMPPSFANRTLTPAQIDLIKRWIDEGAPYEKHWAFVTPKRPPVPEVKEASWVRNPIDNFVLARLQNEGLKPSPEADKATLLRRVSFDLTGLPSTPAEVDAFVADKSSDAYEKRVDRLLASPHYGENMARIWMDLAHYADTHGYDDDGVREMWPWRDWVIKAYNQNMRYDQFTIRQVAGDLLPNTMLDDKIATGFFRNHLIDGENPQQSHVEYLVDRVSTLGTAWLGLSTGCARCHDHKYDPIKQKDFYRLVAFFNTIPEAATTEDNRDGNLVPVVSLPSSEQKRDMESLERELSSTLAEIPEKAIISLENEWRLGALASMPEPRQNGLTAYYEFEDKLADSSGNNPDAKVARGEVGYQSGQVRKALDISGETEVDFAGAGDFRRSEPFSLGLWLDCYHNFGRTRAMDLLQKHEGAANWRGYEISVDDAAFTDADLLGFRVYLRLANRWPGEAIAVRTKSLAMPSAESSRFHHLAVTYDGSGRAAGLKVYVDGKPVAIEVVKDHLTGDFQTPAILRVGNKDIGQSFEGRMDDLRIYNRVLTASDIENLAIHFPARVLVTALQNKPATQIASLRPEEPPAEPEIVADDKPPMTEQERDARRLNGQQAILSEYFLRYAAPKQYRYAYARLTILRTGKERLEQSIPTTMVMAEMKKPRETFVLGRGQFDNPQDKVTAGVPAFLLPMPKDVPINRMLLAKWLVDPQNPLTARVEINREWQNFFGTGIVKTAEDFGSQGEPPSHPDLLDWLATEFIRTGWDVKAMQRLVVSSATYRQSSRVTSELQERDPENRLLARGPRVRLAAEEIRDSALVASGLLNSAIGGPGVRPYEPKRHWDEAALNASFLGQNYKQSQGTDLYRRSLYTTWKRNSPPPLLATFDVPERDKCMARRTLTNTPLQALMLLNDQTYLEASRVLAQRTILEAGKDPAQRVDFAFRMATGRKPDLKEREVLLQLDRKALAQYQHDPSSALKLLSVGEMKRSEKIDPTELAAWTMVARVILNMDETITKQ